MSAFWGSSSLAVESLPDIPMTLSSITRQEQKKKKKEQTKERGGEVGSSLVPPNETIPGLDLSTLLFQISGPTN